MKFLLLCCCASIFFSLSPMEHDKETLPFCDDLISILQNRIFFKTNVSLFYSTKNDSLSSNYAEFDEHRIKEGCQLANVELAEDSHKFPVFVMIGSKNDYLVKLNRDDEIAFFDGPNKNNVIVSDKGCYHIEDTERNNQEKLKRCSSAKSRKCWCYDCSVFSSPLKFTYSEFLLIDHKKKVGAVAIHNTTNCIAVAYDNGKQQKVILYKEKEDGYLNFSEFKISLKKIQGRFKKISFLTLRTLLALTDEGELVSLVLKKNNKVRMKRQNVRGLSKNLLKVQDYAVDSNNPTQMIMVLENKKLVFGDLVKCTYTPLMNGIDADVLKFYNDTIAFKERDSEQLTLINLLLVKRYMLERFFAQE